MPRKTPASKPRRQLSIPVPEITITWSGVVKAVGVIGMLLGYAWVQSRWQTTVELTLQQMQKDQTAQGKQLEELNKYFYRLPGGP